MDRLIPRLLAELPAVLIVGPRATGKTTTARRYANTVVQLDQDTQAAAFRADPDAALSTMPEPVLLDEWQCVPAVLGAVKRSIGSDHSPGRFILTGSVDTTGTPAWAGTGRLVWVDMHPMTVAERRRSRGTPLLDRIARGEPLEPAADSPNLRGYVDAALEGGFPEAALDVSAPVRRRWLQSYIRQVAERDALQLSSGRDPRRLSRYFEAYALNSAGVTDHKTVYSSAGVNRETGVAYARLLSDLRVIDDLPAWSSNRLTRLVKTPKRNLIDSSLLAAVAGATAESVISDGDLLGRLIETFVVAQLRAEAAASDTNARLYHQRDAQGRHEVDVIAELGGGGSWPSRSSPPARRDRATPAGCAGSENSSGTASWRGWSSTPAPAPSRWASAYRRRP